MKPYVIKMNDDFLNGPELRFDGLAAADDTREAMRFETEDEALKYIAKNGDVIRNAGGDPSLARTIFTLPTGITHQ